ncbi:MAG: hypothetical protein EOM12_17445 [Verrucomicrobiae bacterium]|nr:hypothetical protein [Verrucomicrobiae bacterium]
MPQTLQINDEFQEVDVLSVDSRNRITLGKHLKDFKRLKVFKDDRGDILLVPIIELPAAETWLFENKQAFSSVQRGLADAKADKITEIDLEDL